MYSTHKQEPVLKAKPLASYVGPDLTFGLVLRSQEDGAGAVRTFVFTDINPDDSFTISTLVNQLTLVEVLFVFTDHEGTHHEDIEPIEFANWMLYPETARRYEEEEGAYSTLHLRLLAYLRGKSAWHIRKKDVDLDIICPNAWDIDPACHAIEESYGIADLSSIVVSRCDYVDGKLVHTNEYLTAKRVYATTTVAP